MAPWQALDPSLWMFSFYLCGVCNNTVYSRVLDINGTTSITPTAYGTPTPSVEGLRTSNNMAEVGTPSAMDIATARQPSPSNAPKDKSAPPNKPERPDDEAYKSELAKAEKELRSAEERMVCIFQWQSCTCNAHAMRPACKMSF